MAGNSTEQTCFGMNLMLMDAPTDGMNATDLYLRRQRAAQNVASLPCFTLTLMHVVDAVKEVVLIVPTESAK